jgi:hypothetical protein
MSNGQRPTVATVFGVLNVIFGGLGAFGILAALALLALPGTKILGALALGSGAASVILLISGIFLLTNKKNALSVTTLAIMLSAALTAAQVIMYLVLGMGIGAAITTIVTGLIYPALIFFLLLKNENVKSWYSSRG